MLLPQGNLRPTLTLNYAFQYNQLKVYFSHASKMLVYTSEMGEGWSMQCFPDWFGHAFILEDISSYPRLCHGALSRVALALRTGNEVPELGKEMCGDLRLSGSFQIHIFLRQVNQFVSGLLWKVCVWSRGSNDPLTACVWHPGSRCPNLRLGPAR